MENQLQLWRIELPYMVCGFECTEIGKIVRSAPIINWAKNRDTLIAWVETKKGKIEII